MSRCFPFPPPGYEKKSRAEDADLLKKEKSREKKHKKEKKEKEKREGKEKRDKDKSDEKRREKKDKKKDKDRDKKKDRDKEKEKTHALEESRPLGKIASQNGEEIVRVKHNSVHEEKHSGQFDSYVGYKIEEKPSLQLDSYLGNNINQNIFLSKETKNSKLVLEVGKRIEDSGTAKIVEKHSGQLDSYVGNKISQNPFLSKDTKNSKLVPEVGKRIEDSGTAKVEKFAVAQPKRDDGMATQVARSSETWFEGKEQNKNRKIDERKYNGQGIRHEERFSGNSAVPSSTATATVDQGIRHEERFRGNSAVPSSTVTATTTVESGVAGMFKQLEKSDERRKETNDKIRPKEGKSKHKDKDKEKKGRSKDKESDKEKKKEKKAKKEKEKKEKVEEKNAMVDKTKEIDKDNLLGRHSTNTNTSQLPDSNIGTAVEENLIKKRKDFEPNGVLHAIDNRSSKLLRPTSQPLKENGRILEPYFTSTLPPPSERETVANNLILVSKERKINGITEAHHPPAFSKHKLGEQDDHPQPTAGAHHPPASSKHKSGGQDDHPQPTAIHKKSPHPDSKYLSQVYSVPEMEKLADSDNQDWLFSSNISQAMKPKLEASEAEEMPQVWAEAMQIESEDVYALPYVIPY